MKTNYREIEFSAGGCGIADKQMAEITNTHEQILSEAIKQSYDKIKDNLKPPL